MDDDLRWLLEYGDEELLNWLELIAESGFRRLRFDDQREVLFCAMLHGERAALGVRRLAGEITGCGVGSRGGTSVDVDVCAGVVDGLGVLPGAWHETRVMHGLVSDLAALGVERVVYRPTAGGHLSNRAEYSPADRSITIYMDSIDRLYQQMLDLRALYFTRPQLEAIHFVHELYHHLEEERRARTDVLAAQETGLPRPVVKLREVGAYTFVNRLLGLPAPCQVLNLLGMTYGWKALRDEAEKYIENLAVRSN